MASPKPKPTALKEAQGNPGKKKLNANEPKPSKELPPCPDWLPPLAKTAWNNLVPELSRIGVLTKIDLNAFERYCVNLALWRQAIDSLLAGGPDLVTTDPTTGEVLGVTPKVYSKRAREYEPILIRYEQEFGLTPSSRSKIQANPTDDADDLDARYGTPLKIAQ